MLQATVGGKPLAAALAAEMRQKRWWGGAEKAVLAGPRGGQAPSPQVQPEKPPGHRGCCGPRPWGPSSQGRAVAHLAKGGMVQEGGGGTVGTSWPLPFRGQLFQLFPDVEKGQRSP